MVFPLKDKLHKHYSYLRCPTVSTLIHFLALQLHKSLPQAVFAQVEILLPHLQHLTVSLD